MDSNTFRKHTDNMNIVSVCLRDNKFLIRKNVFENIPGSRLSKAVKCLSHRKEIYFDRPSFLFEYVLDAYQNEVFHVPHDVCGAVLKDELEFWKIPLENVSPCCLKVYSAHLENMKIMKEIREMVVCCPSNGDVAGARQEDREFPAEQSVTQDSSPAGKDMVAENGVKLEDVGISERKQRNDSCCSEVKNRPSWKRKVNVFLEDPFSSPPALVWGCLFLVLVLASEASEFLSTVRTLRVTDESMINKTQTLNSSCEELNSKQIMYLTTNIHPVLKYLQLVCLIVFSIDLLVRLLTCNNGKKFFFNVYNIIDILALIPMAVLETLYLVKDQQYLFGDPVRFKVIIFLSIMGVFKTLRLVKFARHYNALNIVLLVLKSSMQEMFLILLLMSIGTLIFSILIYYTEFYTEGVFNHIAVGFWWSIVTMTTVGYGDIHPSTIPGYLVGVVCAISGVLFTGLLIPILSSKFDNYYTIEKVFRYKLNMEEEKEEESKQKDSWKTKSPFIRRIKSRKM